MNDISLCVMEASTSNTTNRLNPDMDLVIQAENVVKTYRSGAERFMALKGVNFSVARGEMVAVMGPPGCGKTTLLNCLSGLDDIDSGHVSLENIDLTELSERDRTVYRARRMGFIFRVYNLLPWLSAVENVELPLLVAGIRPKDARERAMVALELVDLTKRADHCPAQLSGGQRQRMTVARALVTDPAIIWADEPTGAPDSRMVNDVIDLIREINERSGLTFVIVTHDAEIGDQCDRIVHMDDGKIMGEDASERLMTSTHTQMSSALPPGRLSPQCVDWPAWRLQ